MKSLPEVTAKPTLGQTVPDPRRRSHFASINGVSYRYPVCDRCKRDVMAFTWADHFEHDGDRDGDEPMRTFFAGCHGKIEAVSVPQSELQATKGADFRIERAFVEKRPIVDGAARELPETAIRRLSAIDPTTTDTKGLLP